MCWHEHVCIVFLIGLALKYICGDETMIYNLAWKLEKMWKKCVLMNICVGKRIKVKLGLIYVCWWDDKWMDGNKQKLVW